MSPHIFAVSANSSATVPVHQFFGGVVDGFGDMCLLHERDVSFTISGSELPWDSSHNKFTPS